MDSSIFLQGGPLPIVNGVITYNFYKWPKINGQLGLFSSPYGHRSYDSLHLELVGAHLVLKSRLQIRSTPHHRMQSSQV